MVVLFWNNLLNPRDFPIQGGGPHPLGPRMDSAFFLYPLLLFLCAVTVPQLAFPLSVLMLFAPVMGPDGTALRNFLSGVDFKKAAAVLVVIYLIITNSSDTTPEVAPSAMRRTMDIQRGARRSPSVATTTTGGGGGAAASDFVNHIPHREISNVDNGEFLEYAFVDDSDPGISGELILFLLLPSLMFVMSHWGDLYRNIIMWLNRHFPPRVAQSFVAMVNQLGLAPAPPPRGMSPTNPDVIASLEQIRCRGDEGECSVCLETFKARDDARKLSCQHLFHASCLHPWLQQRSSCPSCRADLNAPNGAVGGGGFPDQQRARPSTSQRSNVIPGEHEENASLRARIWSRQTWERAKGIMNHVRTRLTEIIRNVRGGVVTRDDDGPPTRAPPPTPPTATSIHASTTRRSELERLSNRELKNLALRRRINVRGIVDKEDFVSMILRSEQEMG